MSRKSHRQRYEVFLAQLREARQRAGVTQIDTAGALSQTQTFISKVERGERRLDVIDLIDFLRVYGEEPAAFVSELCDSLAEPTTSEVAPSRRRRVGRK